MRVVFRKLANFTSKWTQVNHTSEEAGHEPDDSWLIVHAKHKTGDVPVGVACNKKVHNF